MLPAARSTLSILGFFTGIFLLGKHYSLKILTTNRLKFVFPNFYQKNTNIKQTLMVYKVAPGDIFTNNYGRGRMKPSHQACYDMI